MRRPKTAGLCWVDPAEYGRRNCKRVRVRGYIDGSRISNGYHTNKSDRLGAGKMYARLRPWHRKGVRAWAVCVTSPRRKCHLFFGPSRPSEGYFSVENLRHIVKPARVRLVPEWCVGSDLSMAK